MRGKNEKEFYTTHEAAKALKITPTTVIDYIKQGYLKAAKTRGGHRRIPAEEINREIERMNEGLK